MARNGNGAVKKTGKASAVAQDVGKAQPAANTGPNNQQQQTDMSRSSSGADIQSTSHTQFLPIDRLAKVCVFLDIFILVVDD